MDQNKHITILSILLITFDSLLFLTGIGFIKGFSFISTFLHDSTANLIVSSVGRIIGTILLLVSVPAIIAGIGLIYRKAWSRILALIICVLKLFNLPFGTALGVYGIWVLMHDETIELLDK